MSDYEGESNESDSDFEETDSVVWDESDNDIDESEKKNELLEQKLKLILRYNADIVDLDKFNKQLKDINQRLEDLTFVSEYSNNDLLNKEYEFIELLNNYIGVIKKNAQPGFLKDYQINTINNLYNEIKNLRKEYIKEEINDNEPLNSGSLDETFNNLIIEEEKYLKNIVAGLNKKTHVKIIIPKRKDYPSDQEYNKAYIQFYRTIGKYIQGESAHQLINVTSIGSSYDKFNKTVKNKFLEDIKLNQQLPIKVSQKDTIFAKNKILLKMIMMKMNETQLIECAKQTEIYNIYSPDIQGVKEKFEFNPSVLEKIKNYYKKSGKNEIPGVITKTLRDKRVQELINYSSLDQKLMKQLEIEIYTSSPDFIQYNSKINDIIFIFRNYPNFKKYLRDGKISVQQLVLFEKEITFETLINITSIKNRRSVINQIKSELLKKGVYSSKLVNNYKSNIFSKRLELLILDISQNEKIYNTFVIKLITIIKNFNVFNMKPEEILLMLKNQPEKKQKEDYSKLDVSSIKALISQEVTVQDELEKKINIIEKDVVSWILPVKIINDERKKWELLLKKNKIVDLINYRKELLRKYSLPNDSRIIELKKKINHSIEKYDNLTKELIDKNENEVKFNILNYPVTVQKEIKITRKPSLVKEVIQAYKRNLMIVSLNISQSYKNKLINLLELIDFNDIPNKRNFLLQKKLFTEVTRLLPTGYIFENFNKFYYNKSIEDIASYLHVPPNKLDKINCKFSFTPGENKLIKDFYGYDLINKLYRNKTPEDYYNFQTQKDFFELNKKSQIVHEPVYRRLRVLYDPYTGKFGNDALNGYLFDVEKLAMGQDGKPLEDFTIYESIDPRTNQMIYEKVKIPVPGKIPFIKVPILTNKKDNSYIWVSAKPTAVKMYTNDYDSCSRFNKFDCNKGKGIGNSNCIYDTVSKKCKANYNLSFGKLN